MNENNKGTYLLINSLAGGGAERQFSILAKHQLFEKVFCLEHENGFLEASNIVYLSKHTSKTSSLYKYLSVFRYTYRLYQQLKGKENVKVVAVMERSFMVGYLISFVLPIKLILSFQVSYNAFHSHFRLKIFNLIAKKVFSRTAKMVPNSYALATELATSFPKFSDKIVAIPNGYNFQDISDDANQSNAFEYPELLNTQYLLCVARFFDQKAQDRLIKAFHPVQQKHKDIKLVFAGTGPLMNQCMLLAKELNFKVFRTGTDLFSTDYDIYFLGFQKNPLVLMKHAYLFTFPTHQEGLPNALIEAMICNCVPISSDCPTGPREIIAPGTNLASVATDIEIYKYGVLIPPFSNANAELLWTNAINKLIEDKVLYTELKNQLHERLNTYQINEVLKLWHEIL